MQVGQFWRQLPVDSNTTVKSSHVVHLNIAFNMTTLQCMIEANRLQNFPVARPTQIMYVQLFLWPPGTCYYVSIRTLRPQTNTTAHRNYANNDHRISTVWAITKCHCHIQQ